MKFILVVLALIALVMASPPLSGSGDYDWPTLRGCWTKCTNAGKKCQSSGFEPETCRKRFVSCNEACWNPRMELVSVESGDYDWPTLSGCWKKCLRKQNKCQSFGIQPDICNKDFRDCNQGCWNPRV